MGFSPTDSVVSTTAGCQRSEHGCHEIVQDFLVVDIFYSPLRRVSSLA